VTVRVRVRIKPGAGRLVAHSEGVWRDLERRADNVIIHAEATAPVDTGQYAFGTIKPGGFRRDRIHRPAGAKVRVTALDPKALIIEKGSRPHLIEPRTKKALAWPGAEHPVRRVRHPGTKAHHTLRNALFRAAGKG
jgi:hypothetical protein